MAQQPLATKGNFLHIYDFRVTKGKEDEFIRLFEEFDYSDGNPMHKSAAQVKDGALVQDVVDGSPAEVSVSRVLAARGAGEQRSAPPRLAWNPPRRGCGVWGINRRRERGESPAGRRDSLRGGRAFGVWEEPKLLSCRAPPDEER